MISAVAVFLVLLVSDVGMDTCIALIGSISVVANTKKTNNKKELGVFITPGRVLVDGQTKANALKSYVYGGYPQAYYAMLEMEL